MLQQYNGISNKVVCVQRDSEGTIEVKPGRYSEFGELGISQGLGHSHYQDKERGDRKGARVGDSRRCQGETKISGLKREIKTPQGRARERRDVQTEERTGVLQGREKLL